VKILKRIGFLLGFCFMCLAVLFIVIGCCFGMVASMLGEFGNPLEMI